MSNEGKRIGALPMCAPVSLDLMHYALDLWQATRSTQPNAGENYAPKSYKKNPSATGAEKNPAHKPTMS